MICAKNYQTVYKFVKVMPRILWPLFFPDTVYVQAVETNQQTSKYLHETANKTLQLNEMKILHS